RRNQASRGARVAGGGRDRRPRHGAHEGDANVAAHGRDGRPVEAPLGPAGNPLDPSARGGGGASERDGPDGRRGWGRLARLRIPIIRFTAAREEPTHHWPPKA